MLISSYKTLNPVKFITYLIPLSSNFTRHIYIVVKAFNTLGVLGIILASYTVTKRWSTCIFI